VIPVKILGEAMEKDGMPQIAENGLKTSFEICPECHGAPVECRLCRGKRYREVIAPITLGPLEVMSLEATDDD
jgi:hypothetical protein